MWKEKIKKYLPDILILIGVWIFFYVTYFPIGEYRIPGSFDYSNNFKFVGIILATIGIDIAIRKYLSSKE